MPLIGGPLPDNVEDITGREYNSLIVVKYAGLSKSGRRLWRCSCKCGGTILTRSDHLKSGNTKTCGCDKKKKHLQRITKHGMTGGRKGKITPEYYVWQAIIQRCTNPNYPKWDDYGGRGITVSKEWKYFVNFYNDMDKRPSDDHEIERKDNELGYYKENCVWATRYDQVRNTRRNVWLTYNGITLCIADWTIKLNFPHNVIRKRLKLGWSVEKTLTTEIRK